MLGPFQGHVACQTIAVGKGVCGTAVAQSATQLVRDVEWFPGHIACDGASRSEIVVPVLDASGKVCIYMGLIEEGRDRAEARKPGMKENEKKGSPKNPYPYIPA